MPLRDTAPGSTKVFFPTDCEIISFCYTITSFLYKNISKCNTNIENKYINSQQQASKISVYRSFTNRGTCTSLPSSTFELKPLLTFANNSYTQFVGFSVWFSTNEYSCKKTNKSKRKTSSQK